MSRRLDLRVPVALAFGFVASAQAGDACSAHSAVGVYMLKCSGVTTLAPPSNEAPVPVPEGLSFSLAEVSVQVRHKDGSVSGKGWLSLGGVVGTHAYTEQATTNPDCTVSETVTQTFNDQPLATTTFFAVVGSDGKQIDSISTSQSNTVLCTATRIDNSDRD